MQNSNSKQMNGINNNNNNKAAAAGATQSPLTSKIEEEM